MLVLALVAAATGCNIPGDPVLQLADSDPPRVLATRPADGATGVDPQPTIEVDFDGPLDPTTIRANFRLVQGEGEDACATGLEISLCPFRPRDEEVGNGPYTVRLLPGTEGAEGCERITLALDAPHALCIGTGLTDAAGNPLPAPVVVTFTTAP